MEPFRAESGRGPSQESPGSSSRLKEKSMDGEGGTGGRAEAATEIGRVGVEKAGGGRQPRCTSRSERGG